jgi:exodeoxyribonuclease-3
VELVSWNVNGLRAVIRNGAGDFLTGCGADAICLQEVRARPDQVDLDLPGYAAIWNPAERAGYSGTLILHRDDWRPRTVRRELGHPRHDGEGRVIHLELDDLHLVTVYTPNAQNELKRLDYRQRWDADFLAWLAALDRGKPVVVCGDFNVSHREIDLARPQANRRNAGFTDEERAAIDNLLAAGFVDTFRLFEPGGGHYTWWSRRVNARERNVGWRLDYFFVSERLRPRVRAATILADVMGSDHCPVGLTLADS